MIRYELDVSDSIGSSLEAHCEELAIKEFKKNHPDVNTDDYQIVSDIVCVLKLYPNIRQ